MFGDDTIDKFKKILIFIFIFLSLSTVKVYAEDDFNNLMEKELEVLNLDDIENKIKTIQDGENELLENFSLYDFTKEVIFSEEPLTFKEKFEEFLKFLFKEILVQASLMGRIIIISLAASVISSLNASFKGKSVGEIGFFICYTLLIITVLSSFKNSLALVEKDISAFSEIVKTVMPAFSVLLLTLNNIGSNSMIIAFSIFGIGILSEFVSFFILPLISVNAVLTIVNNTTPKGYLTYFCTLFKNIVKWGLKISAAIFMAIITLSKIGGGGASNFLGNLSKNAVKFVPVVGNTLSGAVDTIASVCGAAMGGLSVAVIVFTVLFLSISVIKLVSIIFVYKFTAAIIEPICEKRFVSCIDKMGDFTALLLASLLTVSGMFIFTVIILCANL